MRFEGGMPFKFHKGEWHANVSLVVACNYQAISWVHECYRSTDR